MNVKSHIPLSNKDDTWVNHYIAKIGEEGLFRIKNYIYDLCDKLKVGEHLDIATWINHVHKKCANLNSWSPDDTADLFIKIIWCYMTESNGTYCFSNDYQQFRNYIADARKMDQQPAVHSGQYQDRNTRENSGATWMQTLRTEAVPTS